MAKHEEETQEKTQSQEVALLISDSDLATWTPEERMDYLRLTTKIQAAPVMSREKKETEYIGKPLGLIEIGMHRNPRFDKVDPQTGEVTFAYRTVFFLDDGQNMSFTSEAASRFAQEIVRVMQSKVFEPPMKIQINRVSLSVGNTFGFVVL